MKRDNGISLADLINLAKQKKLAFEGVYLLTADGNPIVEIDYSEDCPDLWFLGDVEV